jgi:galactonate dehydratase
MRITAIETVQVEEFSNMLWVRVHTDEGLVGLGETFRNPVATAAYVHETCAPWLLGKDPLQIERHAHTLRHRVGNHFEGFPSRSVEIRGNSAIDLALWDIFGKASGLPLHQLLGGLSRERIRIYNTCASVAYNAKARADANSKLIPPDMERGAAGALDDLEAQHLAPGELARSLLEDGIPAMKIWPFDAYALESNGHHIAPADLRRGAAVVEAIRDAVGEKVDIMLEFHALWHLPAALQIADRLSEHDIYWYEDPIDMANFDDPLRYREGVISRVTGSENLGTRTWYREAFQRGAIDVAHFDIGWIGGLTEGRKVAALAEAFDRPIAPHDCTGPVQLCANVHMLMAAPNALVLETVRAHYRGYYQQIVTALPRIEHGFACPMAGPGIGTELQPELLGRADATIRRSAA